MNVFLNITVVVACVWIFGWTLIRTLSWIKRRRSAHDYQYLRLSLPERFVVATVSHNIGGLHIAVILVIGMGFICSYYMQGGDAQLVLGILFLSLAVIYIERMGFRRLIVDPEKNKMISSVVRKLRDHAVSTSPKEGE